MLQFNRCFTHVDPFEDTERASRSRAGDSVDSGFTHVDPFEDTESRAQRVHAAHFIFVSPTSIRSRILKGRNRWPCTLVGVCFTHVDPFEDTESQRAELQLELRGPSFTHVDPFEDTESYPTLACATDARWFHPRRSVRGY